MDTQLKDFAGILSERLNEPISPEDLKDMGRNGFNTAWLVMIKSKLKIHKIDSISLHDLLTIDGGRMAKKLHCDLTVFRCTRNQQYAEDTAGYKDADARQGHYIQALSAADAIAKMYQKFPEDTKGFTVQRWDDRLVPLDKLQFIENAPNPSKLDVVRNWVKLEAGQTLEKAMELLLIHIADHITGNPSDVECEGMVGLYQIID